MRTWSSCFIDRMHSNVMTLAAVRPTSSLPSIAMVRRRRLPLPTSYICLASRTWRTENADGEWLGPIQQKQHQAGQQDIGAALDGRVHESCSPAFERRSGHDAVLDGEQAKQQ